MTVLALPQAPEWQNDAACLEVEDPEVFFPREETAVIDIRTAKAICAGCPVAADCLEFALRTDTVDDGIFGGMTARERAVLRG